MTAVPAVAVFKNETSPGSDVVLPPLFVTMMFPADALPVKRSSPVAEASTVTGPVPSPRPAALLTTITPSTIDVPPAYEFAPASVSVPVPVLVSPPPVSRALIVVLTPGSTRTSGAPLSVMASPAAPFTM